MNGSSGPILGIAACLVVACATGRSGSVKSSAAPGAGNPEANFSAQLTTMQSRLGERLFLDTRLSRDGKMSCATCHQPSHGFAEPRAVSAGLGPMATRRNTPSLANLTLVKEFDWDGRARTLESQLHGVYSVRGDMGITLGDAVSIIRKLPEYQIAFVEAFSRLPDAANLRSALATYQRSLSYSDSRFDRFYFQGDSGALSQQEQRGWKVFQTKANCTGCHLVLAYEDDGHPKAIFSDRSYHNLGVGYSDGRMKDLGRYAVTRRKDDWGSFRTPGLRNVAITGPYMHDGSLETLEDVIAFYADGGVPNPNLDVTIGKQSLSPTERADLAAFLRTLTSETLLRMTKAEDTTKSILDAHRERTRLGGNSFGGLQR